MQFENLYQELAGGVAMNRALVVGMTVEQVRSELRRSRLEKLVASYDPGYAGEW